MDDETRRDVLGEAVMEELRAIREYVSDVPEMKTTINRIDERLVVVEGDLQVVKLAVRHISDELHEVKEVVQGHGRYIEMLKSKVA